MASPVRISRLHERLTSGVETCHRRLALPSWLASTLLHAALLGAFIWLSQTRGCGPDYVGDDGEGFREVGVYLTSGETDREPAEVPIEESSTTPTDPPPEPESTSLLDGPPIEVQRPAAFTEPVLGIGGPPEIDVGSPSSPSWQTTPLTGPPPSVPAVLGKSTSLFGIQDAGRRFVYVLDRSGSMDSAPLRSAKAELMASLENLDATQQFQVIFYNDRALPLVPRSKRFDMFLGVDLHRLEVKQQLEMISADGGTSHLEALEASLKYNADVIFFLTDADDLNLNAHELADITRRNNGGARIHCIEFGSGPDLTLPSSLRNSLQKLAEQNRGDYRYIDVSKWR